MSVDILKIVFLMLSTTVIFVYINIAITVVTKNIEDIRKIDHFKIMFIFIAIPSLYWLVIYISKPNIDMVILVILGLAIMYKTVFINTIFVGLFILIAYLLRGGKNEDSI